MNQVREAGNRIPQAYRTNPLVSQCRVILTDVHLILTIGARH
jgi:hypothetical protein